MDNKIKRRIFLGTLIGGLSLSPFVILSFRSRALLSKLFYYYRNSDHWFSVPHKFDIEFDDWSDGSMSGTPPADLHSKRLERFYALPEDIQEIILKTRKKYWANFARISKVEFDYARRDYDKNGLIVTTMSDLDLDGHVVLKYGYGYEIKGKDILGNPRHVYLNLFGSSKGSGNIILMFFEAFKAFPSGSLFYDDVYSTDAKLPENPCITPQVDDRYTVLCYDVPQKNICPLPPHIEEKIYLREYYNNRTGMLEYVEHQSCEPEDGGEDLFLIEYDSDNNAIPGTRYLNPKFNDPNIPLPNMRKGFEYFKNQEVAKGVFLPSEHGRFYDGIRADQETYNNIQVKKLRRI